MNKFKSQKLWEENLKIETNIIRYPEHKLINHHQMKALSKTHNFKNLSLFPSHILTR